MITQEDHKEGCEIKQQICVSSSYLILSSLLSKSWSKAKINIVKQFSIPGDWRVFVKYHMVSWCGGWTLLVWIMLLYLPESWWVNKYLCSAQSRCLLTIISLISVLWFTQPQQSSPGFTITSAPVNSEKRENSSFQSFDNWQDKRQPCINYF